MSDADQLTQRLLGSFDVPAYVRRGLRVAQRRAVLLGQCRKERWELLRPVRWRAGQLCRALTDPAEFERLVPEAAERDRWRKLWDVLEISADGAQRATLSRRQARRMMRETCESLDRFNRAWRTYLGQLDLASVNGEIEAYNRYYLLEKECALRSPRLARLGYQPLSLTTTGDLLAQFPLLRVPRLAKDR